MTQFLRKFERERKEIEPDTVPPFRNEKELMEHHKKKTKGVTSVGCEQKGELDELIDQEL